MHFKYSFINFTPLKQITNQTKVLLQQKYSRINVDGEHPLRRLLSVKQQTPFTLILKPNTNG